MVDSTSSLDLGGVSRLAVDGNNVMGSRPDGWWRDRPAAAARLVRRLSRLASDAGVPVTVAFDGRRPPGTAPPPDGVEVRYAGHGGRDAADDVLAALVADADDPAALLVVTADRDLCERVARTGAHVIGPRTLLAALDRLEGAWPD